MHLHKPVDNTLCKSCVLMDKIGRAEENKGQQPCSDRVEELIYISEQMGIQQDMVQILSFC